MSKMGFRLPFATNPGMLALHVRPRAVAQLGRARRSGRRGPGFKSLQPDVIDNQGVTFISGIPVGD